MSTSNTGAAIACATHPNVETYLRCAQCGKPICPRCLVMTPVGAKCAVCAKARLLPTFVLSPLNVIVAFFVTLFVAVGLGLIGSIVLRIVPLLLIAFPFGVGIVLAEAISRSVNRKRHLYLQILAGAGVVLSYLVLGFGEFFFHGPLELLQSGMLVPLALNVVMGTIISPFTLIFVAIGVWIAVYRVR
ncbi:MAG TPA: B-box zinc finger protein [Chloroflexota bacterium]|nr:B-box zinc finger protein [Chloroflexota bacterium]